MPWLAVALVLLAQGSPMTNVVVSGAESLTFTVSDTNACYIDDSNNALNAQLTDPTSGMVISFTVLGTVGDHPAKDQLTALSFDAQGADPFVSWNGTSGTVTLEDVAASVPVESGDASISASTHGVRGHIEADLTSKQGTIHLSGPFACHSPQ